MMEVEASSERPVALASALDSRISGSFRNRYEQELFRNTGQFPIANLLLELLLEGPAIFLAPDIYTLIGAMLLQAWVLARWENTPAPRRFLGNLVGPAAYTAIEACFAGAYGKAGSEVVIDAAAFTKYRANANSCFS